MTTNDIFQKLQQEGHQNALQTLKMKLNESNQNAKGFIIDIYSLRQLKEQYRNKLENISSHLNGLTRTQLGEIERASKSFQCQKEVESISHRFQVIQELCQENSQALGGENNSRIQAINTARKNLDNTITQYEIYKTIPDEVNRLMNEMEKGSITLLELFSCWKKLDKWSIGMKNELGDEELSSKSHDLNEIHERMQQIQKIGEAVQQEIQNALHSCIELAQFNPEHLKNAFEIINKLQCDKNSWTIDVIHELEESAEARISNILTNVSEEVDVCLEACTSLLLDLNIVKEEVMEIAEKRYNILNIFIKVFNKAIEEKLLSLSKNEQICVGNRLQLVEWIDYYVSEINKHEGFNGNDSLIASIDELMNCYMESVMDQIRCWTHNVWNREEKPVLSEEEGMITPSAEDIFTILQSQIQVAASRLSGSKLVLVLKKLVELVKDMYCDKYNENKLLAQQYTVEEMCASVNGIYRLQSKFVELIEICVNKISGDDKTEIKEFFDLIGGDMVNVAISFCKLISKQIVQELESDVFEMLFTTSWMNQEPVVDNLLCTFDDYFKDLREWIQGVFFFPKIIRNCLEITLEYYSKYLLEKKQPFNCFDAAIRIDEDCQKIVEFFDQYGSDLKRSGLRTTKDIQKLFSRIKSLRNLLTYSPITTVDNLPSNVKEGLNDHEIEAIFYMRQDKKQTSKSKGDSTTSSKLRPNLRGEVKKIISGFKTHRNRSHSSNDLEIETVSSPSMASSREQASTFIETTSSLSPSNPFQSNSISGTNPFRNSGTNPFKTFNNETKTNSLNPFSLPSPNSPDNIISGSLEAFLNSSGAKK